MKKVTLELSAQELDMVLEPLVSVLSSDTFGTSQTDDPKRAIKEWQAARATYVSRWMRVLPPTSKRDAKAKRRDFMDTRAAHDETVKLLEKIIGDVAKPRATRSTSARDRVAA